MYGLLLIAVMVEPDFELELLLNKQTMAKLEVRKAEAEYEHAKRQHKRIASLVKRQALQEAVLDEEDYKLASKQIAVDIAKCKLEEASIHVRRHRSKSP